MANPDKLENQGSERPSGPTDDTAVYTGGGSGEELVRVLDQYLADLEAGRAPSREKLLAEHPALASQLEPCLSGMEFIHRAARPTVDSPSRLGDFEIVTEVGRGGMGVVYEAQQLSLKRKVALKVLRFGGVADRDAMERFQREAETVAQLHHTNIVPIFAIGEQKGVFYYAMQFIEGRSLAAVLEQSQKEAAPLKLVESARWALQAAEALAHAHQRGVIHRDVKPSNLILDPAGQIWLTDFGLAKRLDDGTLSMTGALLGTPRYMSPEQASAAKQPVDQRTDIYSLGATLYELATGKPLFEADSPHGIISQILTTEPPSPRSLRTGLPRDLETIILKCLAKEASGRYPAAQALADDLRAFTEGRAIKARRASIAERTVRWVQKRKKSAAVASIAAAATLAVAIVSYTMLSSWAAARLAHISLKTDGPDHLKVELLDESEHKAVATFTAPTQEPQSFPAGRYHVRLSKAGHLSETAQLDAAAGGWYDATAALSPRSLWEIRHTQDEVVQLARFDGRDDVFLASQNELRRLRGDNAQPIWKISVAARDQPLVERAVHGNLNHWPFFARSMVGFPGYPSASVARPTLDLDGDGAPDLIWASRTMPALVAVSGKSGKVLWCHVCDGSLRDKIHDDDFPKGGRSDNIAGTIVGEPLLAEVGGKKVVLAACALVQELFMPAKKHEWLRADRELWLEALDARTGNLLWRRRMDWNEQAVWCSAAFWSTVWRSHGRVVAAIASNNRLLGFDLLSGEPAWPDRDLGPAAPLVVRFADLRGDGELEARLLRETAATPGEGAAAGPNPMELRLTAISPKSPAPLWDRALPFIVSPGSPYGGSPGPEHLDWPFVADLEGKGKPKIIVPFVDRKDHACGLEVMDGATGQTSWKKRLSHASQNWDTPQLNRIVVGPDLDGDGFREIFAASHNNETERVYVDALSGRDGRLFWSNQQLVLGRGGQPAILPLRWWQPGSDGWPSLMVSYGDQLYLGSAKANVAVMAASTGRIEQEAREFGAPQVCDLNGDGLPDLLVFEQPGPLWQNSGAALRVIKGMAPEAWRVLGKQLIAEQDFNRDGFTDLFSPSDGSVLSGRDASTLWRCADLQNTSVVSNPLRDADLDGDGTPDLLSMSYFDNRKANLVATSGRDGKTLWTSQLLITEDNSRSGSFSDLPPHLAGHILQEGHKPDVLVLYQRQRHDNPRSTPESRQTRLVRLSGHDGSLVWEQAIDEFNTLDIRSRNIPFATADLDGDGVKDIVFWLPLPAAEPPFAMKENAMPGPKDSAAQRPAKSAWPTFQLLAVSGRDGKVLWRRPGFFTNNTFGISQLGEIPAPVICDRKGDGNPLVLVTDQCVVPNCPGWNADKRLAPDGVPGIRTEVLALDGKSGKSVWSWCGGAAPYFHPLESTGDWLTASPQVVRTAAGPAIAVSVFDVSLRARKAKEPLTPTVTEKYGNQIVLLNIRGELLQEMENGSPRKPANIGQRIWVRDLLGDGLDELVWCDSRTVRAMRPGDKKILWESEEMPTFFNINSIQPAGKGFPATVTVQSVNGMVGLAGPTGKARWRCEAAHSENDVAASLLETDDPKGLPRISAHAGSAQTCYFAIATDDRGSYVLPQPTPRSYDAEVVDRRFAAPLPWNRPAGIRSFQEDWSGTWIVVLIVVTSVASIVGWWPGKLRRAAWLFGLWFVPSLVIEVIRFILENRELGPNEHYDWSNWSEVSINEWRIVIGILLQIVIVWWLMRIARWCGKKVAARIKRPLAAGQ